MHSVTSAVRETGRGLRARAHLNYGGALAVFGCSRRDDFGEKRIAEARLEKLQKIRERIFDQIRQGHRKQHRRAQHRQFEGGHTDARSGQALEPEGER